MARVIVFLIVVVCLSCTKKDLTLDLIETKCKKFKIYSPNYSWITDPSCGGSPLTAELKISFKHEGEPDCIHLIDLNPEFYNASDDIIQNVSFSKKVYKSEPDVFVYNDSVTFVFRFTFANSADADALNHIYLKFNTENELGNVSKSTEVRINAGCSVVSPSSYTVGETVTVTEQWVKCTFWDDASEDGDIICVYLNGVWVLENLELTNAEQSFYFQLKPKGSTPQDNHLVIFAVNEGDVGPNTMQAKINDGTAFGIDADLLTGQAVNIVF